MRLGVAPDHPKIKSVSRAFERIAAKPGFRFFGNVGVGQDVSPADLARLYDAVVYAFGAQSDRRMGIPGEDQAKVTYKLDDAAKYVDNDILVVGGGDSAIHAAVALSHGAR